MSFSSFYIGATGMKTHAQGLQVISNNLANVNTVGYKESAYRFQDLLGDSTMHSGTVNGYTNPGQGVSLQTVTGDFSQGSLETSNTVTDLSVMGKGWFGVSDQGSIYYTRAGNFRFNQLGALVDPHGYIVQGASGGIVLDMENGEPAPMTPMATTQVDMITNLAGADSSGSAAAGNPFFGLFGLYNGASGMSTGLAEGSYAYYDAIRVYDADGVGHDLHFHFDPVSSSGLSNAGSSQYWEFTVSLDPSEEGRADFIGTSGAGLLMTGVMTFNSAGGLESIAAFSYAGSGDVKSLSNWTPAAPVGGTFQVTPTYLSSAGSTISLNFGLSLTGASGGTVSNATGVGINPANLPDYTGTLSGLSTTAYNGSASTLRSDQDGYTTGYMLRVNIDSEGNIIGHYTNGQNQVLDRLQLYRFPSEYNLDRKGDNLFAATPQSGAAIQGNPGEAGFGDIQSNALETSNVDIAREFVLMISTQRGFQANSKVITTTDQLLQTAVQLKR